MQLFSRQARYAFLIPALAIVQMASAQTFRGGIAGTVQDSAGSVIQS
jgi:hypothetical protein